MKTAFAAALLSLCLSAQAFYILIDAGPAAWLEGHKVEQVSVELFNGDPAIPGELARSRQPFDVENLKAVNGKVTKMTEAEIAARDEAEAQAAQAAADAQAAQESLPAVFPSGIAVLDAAGHHIELVPAGDGLPVLGYQVSNSPLDKSQRDTMKAERAAASAALAATAKDAKINDKQKIALLMQAVFGVRE